MFPCLLVSGNIVAETKFASQEAKMLPNKFGNIFVAETMVVYHLHEKPIWFQTVQIERKHFDWKIPFGACAFHFP